MAIIANSVGLHFGKVQERNRILIPENKQKLIINVKGAMREKIMG